MNNRISHAPFFSFGHRTGLSLLFFLCLFTFVSCKHGKKITLNNGKCILDYKNAKTLAANLKANQFKFDQFSAKFSAEVLIDSSSSSFTISLRMKKDSIIWMSISKLGIEGLRVLITKDSVKYINRQEKQYFAGDFAYIGKLLNTELDFEILQSLLVGNSVEFYEEDEKLKPGVDNCQYTLGTIRKYKLRKAGKGKELKEPAQSIYLIPETFKIARILFYEFNPDRSFDARYADYTRVDSSQWYPSTMNFIIKTKKDIRMDISTSKPVLNAEQSFPFKVPDNYEQKR